MALFLLTIYHLIEWFRVIFILIKILLGQNFIPLYYFTYLNSFYGVAVYCYTHYARFSPHGITCSAGQPLRAKLLLLEVIFFWTIFILWTLPQIYMLCFSHEKLARDYIGEEEDGDDESDEEEKDEEEAKK